MLISLTLMCLFMVGCLSSQVKEPLPNIDVKECGYEMLMPTVHKYLRQYTGYMPGDLHLVYELRNAKEFDIISDTDSILFVYQTGMIFDYSESHDRLFFMPCELQHTAQFYSDFSGDRDQAARRLYKYVQSIDFSEACKLIRPIVEAHDVPKQEFDNDIKNTLSILTYVENLPAANLTACIRC